MSEKEGRVHPEDELFFRPNSILALSFPHLNRLLVIDPRADGETQGAFLLNKREIIYQTKEKALAGLREAIMQVPDDPHSLLSFPDQLQALMINCFSEAITDLLVLKPTPSSGSPGVSRPPVTITVFAGSAEYFWSCYQQTFVKNLAGKIDLISDVRARFEELIQEEKQNLVKGGDDSTFFTLWQSPSQN